MVGGFIGCSIVLICVIQVQRKEGFVWAFRTVCLDFVYKIFFDRNEVVVGVFQNFGYFFLVIWEEIRGLVIYELNVYFS